MIFKINLNPLSQYSDTGAEMRLNSGEFIVIFRPLPSSRHVFILRQVTCTLPCDALRGLQGSV